MDNCEHNEVVSRSLLAFLNPQFAADVVNEAACVGVLGFRRDLWKPAVVGEPEGQASPWPSGTVDLLSVSVPV